MSSPVCSLPAAPLDAPAAAPAAVVPAPVASALPADAVPLAPGARKFGAMPAGWVKSAETTMRLLLNLFGAAAITDTLCDFHELHAFDSIFDTVYIRTSKNDTKTAVPWKTYTDLVAKAKVVTSAGGPRPKSMCTVQPALVQMFISALIALADLARVRSGDFNAARALPLVEAHVATVLELAAAGANFGCRLADDGNAIIAVSTLLSQAATASAPPPPYLLAPAARIFVGALKAAAQMNAMRVVVSNELVPLTVAGVLSDFASKAAGDKDHLLSFCAASTYLRAHVSRAADAALAARANAKLAKDAVIEKNLENIRKCAAVAAAAVPVPSREPETVFADAVLCDEPSEQSD
jgi:hypothetical protein